MTWIQKKNKYRPANTRMVYKIPLFFLLELLYCDPDKAPAELPCAECFSWYTCWPIFICLVHFFFGTFYFYWYIFLFFKHVFLLNFSLFGTSSFWNISVFLLHLCFLGASCFSWGPEASSPSKHLNGWNPVKNGFVSGRKCPSVCLVRFILTFSILLPWGSPPCVSLFVCDALS